MAIERREFLINTLKISGAMAVAPAALSLASCSSNKKATNAKNYALLRVSSDIYQSQKEQRLAFAIFDSNRKAVKDLQAINATLISPDNKETIYKNIKIRDKGIKGKGIFSFYPKLNSAGNWTLKVQHKNEDLELSFNVNEKNTAPKLNDQSPLTDTPTDTNPLDAKVLCTRSQGNCGLHQNNLRDLLQSKKPFAILFATPARCQTSYCGPVLELTREVAKEHSIPVIHNEIYKDETTNDVIDSVAFWNLPSEPWLFGIDADGKIVARIDGAFDKSEIEDLFKLL
ncbi:MAG: hypothetical protein U0R17_07190 [Acidimicrobiia bacterium]